MPTWKELKEAVEKAGVKDDDEVTSITAKTDKVRVDDGVITDESTPVGPVARDVRPQRANTPTPVTPVGSKTSHEQRKL